MSDKENFSSEFSEEDAFVIGKGFQLEETENNGDKKMKKRKKKNKGKHSTLRSVIWIVSIIVISLGLAFGIIYAGADFTGIGFGRGNDITIEIKMGSSSEDIANQLEDTGAVKIPQLFRLYAKLKNYDSRFKYGVYTFNTEAGYDAICQMLITEGAKAETVEVKIPEMATIDDIAKILENKGVCNKSDFYDVVRDGEFDFDFIKDIPTQRVHYRLEGYLFPDTYSFYCYDNSPECAKLAVQKMLSNLDSKLNGDILEKIEKSNYSFHEIMTMASIVESESANSSAENRAKVAAVFYNRLEGVNWDGPKLLQTDPSTFYPYGNGRYNTYETEGLPPGPLGSPSINSIKAAISPKKNFNATYFVTDKNSKFYFNETLSAHESTIADLKAKGLWLYTTLGSSK